MNFDYFLIHRAHQVHKLRTAKEGARIELPDNHARGAYPRELGKFFKSIDKICELSVGKEADEGMLVRFASMLSRRGRSGEADSEDDQGLLSDAQRELLLEFERDTVRLRFSKETDAMRMARHVIGAILADHEFFYGLKPLAYADSFGYEFLFPSWFNLFTVLNQKDENTHEPRFSEEQQRTLFSYLEPWKDGDNDTEAELVALLTFAANRFPPPKCFDMMQRTIDLTLDSKANCIDARLRIFWDTRESIENAHDLQNHLEDFLVIQSSVHKPSSGNRFSITKDKLERFGLPVPVVKRLQQLASDSSQSSEFLELVASLRAVYQQSGGLSPNFAGLLGEYPSQMLDILQLASRPRKQEFDPLSRDAQQMVAKIVPLETKEGQVAVDVVQPFTLAIAARTDGFSDGAGQLFAAEFLQKEKNRRAILSGSKSVSKMHQISAQVMKLAMRKSETSTFFQLLSIAVVLDTSIEPAKLEEVLLTLFVLQEVHRNRSIGRNELDDLLADLRGDPEHCLAILERPIQVVADKPDRLGGLYLALHEARETYRHTGRIANFSISRAGFSNLGKLMDGIELDDENPSTGEE